MLIEHMSNGGSAAEFAATLDISTDTLQEWYKRHPEFSVAKKIAWTKSQAWWEKIARDYLITKSSREDGTTSFNTTAWIFTMKNRFGWRDRIDVDTNVTGTIEHTALLPEEKRKALTDVKKIIEAEYDDE